MSEVKDFQAGDLVCLKSGGPLMTLSAPLVLGANAPGWSCVWFTSPARGAAYQGARPERDTFPAATLRHATDSDAVLMLATAKIQDVVTHILERAATADDSPPSSA